MSNSIFIAKLIGPMMIVGGLTYLLNIERLKEVARGLMDSPALLLIAGFLTLLLGLVLVNMHNIWVTDWPLVITLFGWMALASGILRTMFPVQAVSIGSAMIGSDMLLRTLSLLQIVLGGYLSWWGYLAAS
jgi:hypothetical protein